MIQGRRKESLSRVVVIVIAMAGIFMLAMPVAAFELNMADGAVTGVLDVTLGYAVGVRVGKPADQSDLSKANVRDWTFDRGDVYTNQYKITPELELKWKNYGFFGRATGYWDTRIDQRGSGQADYPLGPEAIGLPGNGNGWNSDAEDDIGLGYDIYDLYVYAGYEINDFLGLGYVPIDIRLGNQIFNWGEGSYYLDGINTTNALDFTKLSLPGSEIKEATIATPAVSIQVGLGDNLSLDAYYQFGWSETKLEPAGTFFDGGYNFLGAGGKYSIIPMDLSHLTLDPADEGILVPVLDNTRRSDKDADDQGQFGFAAHYILGDIELGAYFVNFHSQTPVFQYNVPVWDPVSDPYGEEYYADNGFTFIYPENIQMYGVSVSGSAVGWAVAMEVAYKPNAPVVNVGLADASIEQAEFFDHPNADGSFEMTNNGTAEAGTSVDAYDERDVWHGQINLMKQFGEAPLGIDTTWIFLTAAVDYLPGDLTGIPANGPDGQQADEFAWGYSVDIDSTWYNVLPGLDITPGISWMHGVSGYSHFWGNWWEGKRNMQLRVNAVYATKWEIGLNYNQEFNSEDKYAEDGTNANFTVSYKF